MLVKNIKTMKKIVFSNNFYVCLGYVFGFEMKIGEFGDVLLIYCLPVYCNRKAKGIQCKEAMEYGFSDRIGAENRNKL